MPAQMCSGMMSTLPATSSRKEAEGAFRVKTTSVGLSATTPATWRRPPEANPACPAPAPSVSYS